MAIVGFLSLLHADHTGQATASAAGFVSMQKLSNQVLKVYIQLDYFKTDLKQEQNVLTH